MRQSKACERRCGPARGPARHVAEEPKGDRAEGVDRSTAPKGRSGDFHNGASTSACADWPLAGPRRALADLPRHAIADAGPRLAPARGEARTYSIARHPPRPLRDSRQNIRWSTASFRDCAPALGTPTRRSCLVLAQLEPDRDDAEDNAEVGAHRPGSRAASAPPRSATRSSPRPHWRRCSRSDREKHAPADDGRCRCSLELRRISAGILAAR